MKRGQSVLDFCALVLTAKTGDRRHEEARSQIHVSDRKAKCCMLISIEGKRRLVVCDLSTSRAAVPTRGSRKPQIQNWFSEKAILGRSVC